MSGPVRPPLTVAESDGTPTVRPVSTISLNSADFTLVDQGGGTVRIDVNPGGGTSLTDTFVGFGDSSNLLTGNSKFRYLESAGQLILTGTNDTNAEFLIERSSGSGQTIGLENDSSASPTLVVNSEATNAKLMRLDNQIDASAVSAGTQGFTFNMGNTSDTSISMLTITTTDSVSYEVVFNEDSLNDYDIRMESATNANLFFLDGSQDNIGIGSVPDASSRLEVKSKGGFDPTTSTETDMNNGILLNGAFGSAGQGNYGGSLVFTGVGSTRRRAAIAAVQTTSDSDEVGIAFFTHDPASPSTDETVSEHMRLDDNGRLFISDTDIGTTTASGRLHVRTTGTGSTVVLESTDDGATFAPNLDFFRNSGTPAVNDQIGAITFTANDDGGGQSNIARIYVYMEDETAATENGVVVFQVAEAGSLRNNLVVGSTLVSVNSSQRNVDFRVLSDDGTANIYSDAGQNNVGIATQPESSASLHVKNDDTKSFNVLLESTDEDANNGPMLALWRNSASPANGDDCGGISWYFENDAGSRHLLGRLRSEINSIVAGSETSRLYFSVFQSGTEVQTVSMKHSEVVINDGSHDIDFRVESDSNANMLVVDAGIDMVGIGSNPDSTFTGSPPFQIPSQFGVASYAYIIPSTTSPMTLTNDDLQSPLLVHDSGTALTVNLPIDGGIKGQYFRFVSTGGNVTIVPSSVPGDTINGSTSSVTRSTDNQIYECVCIANNTWIVSNP